MFYARLLFPIVNILASAPAARPLDHMQPHGVSAPMYPYNPTQPLPYNPTPDNHLNYGPWHGNTADVPQPPQQTANHPPAQDRQEMPSWNGFSLPTPEEELQTQRRQQAAAEGLYQQGTCPPYAPYGAFPQYPGEPQPLSMMTCPPYPLYPQATAVEPRVLRTEEPPRCKLSIF